MQYRRVERLMHAVHLHANSVRQHGCEQTKMTMRTLRRCGQVAPLWTRENVMEAPKSRPPAHAGPSAERPAATTTQELSERRCRAAAAAPARPLATPEQGPCRCIRYPPGCAAMAHASRRQRAARHRREHHARCSNTSEPDPAVQRSGVRNQYRSLKNGHCRQRDSNTRMPGARSCVLSC